MRPPAHRPHAAVVAAAFLLAATACGGPQRVSDPPAPPTPAPAPAAPAAETRPPAPPVTVAGARRTPYCVGILPDGRAALLILDSHDIVGGFVYQAEAAVIAMAGADDGSLPIEPVPLADLTFEESWPDSEVVDPAVEQAFAAALPEVERQRTAAGLLACVDGTKGATVAGHRLQVSEDEGQLWVTVDDRPPVAVYDMPVAEGDGGDHYSLDAVFVRPESPYVFIAVSNADTGMRACEAFAIDVRAPARPAEP